MMLRKQPDRRDVAGRAALVLRVRKAFEETPGLCVTTAQAARMFGVPDGVTSRILAELVTDTFRKTFVGSLFLPITQGQQRLD